MTKEIAPAPPVRQVWFRLFGPVAAYADGQSLDLGSKRERRLLVALLVAAGSRVARGPLAEWVWDDVPGKPVERLYEVARDLRRRLAAAGLAEKLGSKDGWYSFDVEPERVDIHQFQVMVNRALALDGEPRREMLANALKLCGGGEPLAGLDGFEVESLRARLTGQVREVEIMVNQTDLRHGRFERPLPGLDRLFRSAPDDMRVAGLYMYALHRVGRTADALAVYPRHRKAHTEASGLTVGKPLRDLHKSILDGKTDLGHEVEVFLGGPPVPPATPPEPDEPTGERRSRTDRADAATSGAAPVHATTETVFNAPVNADGHAVFGISIGGGA